MQTAFAVPFDPFQNGRRQTASADPVVGLWREYEALETSNMRNLEVDEDAFAVGCHALVAICGRIAATRATSLPGIVIKLQIVQADLELGDTIHTKDTLLSAIADIERLGSST